MAALVPYVLTMAPSITWRHDGADSGDFVTAALTGGVPHPPGYPTYTLLADLFARLPFADPARGVNLLSAVSAAMACAGTTLASLRLMQGARREDGRAPLGLRLGIAATVGLVLAYSPTLWSQALIAEVHALHALFVATLVLFLAGLGERRREPAKPAVQFTVCGIGLLLGLGAGNHLSVLLLLPAVLLGLRWWAWPGERRVAVWGAAAGLFLLGLAIYLVLPVRASSGPPVNWGDPRTLDQLLWVVTGRLYDRYMFAFPLAMAPGRAAAWVGLLRQQFGLVGIALGLTGCWYLAADSRKVLLVTLAGYFPFVAFAIGYSTVDSHVYLIATYVIFALWIGYGAHALWREASGWRATGLRGLILGAVCAALAVTPLVTHWSAMDLSEDHEARDFATAALQAAPAEALVFVDADGPTFALWYAHYGLEMRPDVTIINASLWQYRWYRDTVADNRPTSIPAGASDVPSADINDLIEANVGRRPICSTRVEALPRQLGVWRPVGPLLCVERLGA